MKRFYIFNAGCIRRGLDMIWVKKYLEINGWHMVSSPKHADLTIIATCGVVKANEDASLKAIKKVIKYKQRDSDIIISGCLPIINPSSITELGEFKFIPPRNLELLDSIIKPKILFNETHMIDRFSDSFPILHYLIARSFCRRSSFYKFLFKKFNMNTNFIKWSVASFKLIYNIKNFLLSKQLTISPYYNIKISDGCLSNCSFCATKFATGNLKSVDPDKIIKEFKTALNKGYKFFQLIGEDTGCYGIDIGIDLAELLTNLFKINKDFKLIIVDYNPYWLIKHQHKIIPLLVKYQHKIKDVFLPIQSGSDRILKLMRRKYTSDELRSVLKEINKKAPEIGIRTSVIVGFPSESEEDFLATVNLLKEINFAEITVNKYEDRPNTISSKMKDKVNPTLIEKRAKFLAKELGSFILS